MSTEAIEDTPEIRKARGAFFTPAPVCDFMARWAVRSPEDRVLEPSCGEADILAAAARRLVTLGGTQPVRGHELHTESAGRARQVLASTSYPGDIHVGDFLDVPATSEFSAVIGNPPYIRYQGFTGESRTRGLSAALAQGVRLSRLSSSWAPFVVHSVGFLRDGGRLALVLPAELLSSNYAGEVRDFLLRRFSSVNVIQFDGLVFPGVQTEALLLLAEGTGGTDRVQFASSRGVEHLAEVEFNVTLTVHPGEKWTGAMVSPAAHASLSAASCQGGFVPLSSWGRLNLGIVTGNNGYFTLTTHEVRGRGLER
ncbi:MAG: N-6 DNA methylase, partial [Actinomycetes bacterium]|nr:N-6 DNA methylase [Actinomycetes bacterium]MDX5380046.1 N-6 DNA methylase [Actinomycetes bacterium]MDX5398606.1 N-6 DNA methylase [Actinomycetes bacterium]MDX5449757.1 N-6 DNA methylase [Actinomycetes bacterium]